MMRCAYAEGRLRALLDGELESAESRKVLSHLEECSRCAEAYSRLQGVMALLQDQELEDAPDHFSAQLQVRLSRQRRSRTQAGNSRGDAPRRERGSLWPARWTPPWRWLGGLTTAAATLAVCLLALSLQNIGAAEVARRAELSWSQIRNYGCDFVSNGVYQGQARVFQQKQFYRRRGAKGEFRLDTSQDYPLTTFVYADRVVHYLPGGDWEGKGPLVIVRPRRERDEALPFPFGVTWQSGGNVSLDQLIRQLNENQDAELLGKERVADHECYHLRFSAVPPGGQQRDQYELWIDQDSFLPRRVSWFRDAQNRIVTEAQNLQVNNVVLPAGTFDFRIPDGSCVVYGDVDPHLLALPYLPARQASYDLDPVASARFEAWARSRSVPFRVLSPRWLPDGFKLVRVRRKQGRWLDVHWIRESASGVNQVLKLVEQDARTGPGEELEGARKVDLGEGKHGAGGELVRRTEPYAHAYLTWVRGNTRCTLFAAELPVEQILRIARSMAGVSAPALDARVARTPRKRSPGPGVTEPSLLPGEPESTTQPEAAVSAETPGPSPEQPPMMPETSDDDRAASQAGGSSRQ